ncbi:hypothetical protein D9M71_326460 [compost metagenome]
MGVLKVPVRGHGQLAVARIDDLLSLIKTQEPSSADGQVQIAPGGLQVAILEVLLNRSHADTQANLGAGIHVGELHARALVAHGLRVGDVVAHHIEVLGGRVETAECLRKAHIDFTPLAQRPSACHAYPYEKGG